ncbi:putative oxidoreductase [Caenibius tardaugens NBRC 16725]|uniref:Putative oxidoreductase n=1 Tax=Caenibius tardaugens NBRC 16725 TaxID=1219035 RepID=U2YNF6_9SPHN|nr:TIGR03619 family F420-dependent LLM class oxidoreductase [Caenibius tardaugens]AZI35148.1 TIGR03619 family F420-dependent LLM class oxidoreductase [Caenibius tardaugens NBRC 16725]GAD50345.1 putative oxidoreductase [Caenibius tardaugens NBRC 16725]
MKFWQMVNWIEVDQLIPLAQFAEELGFEGVMNSDHAVYPKTVLAEYPYSPDGKAMMSPDWPYPDAWVTIAAMAAVTKRLKFSTSIYVLPLRNVFEVAKATGTLALMSDNRFILGAGLGWMKDEFDIYGVEFKTRARRTDEMIDVLRKLWEGGMVEHHGDFYDFPPLQIAPEPTQTVPVFLGGSSAPALKRAATRGDGWIGAGNTPEEVPALMAEFTRLREEAGRAHLPFETLIGLSTPPDLDTFKRLHDQGMTAGISYPFFFSLGLHSSLDDKKRVMEQFAKAFIRPFENA